MKVIAKKTFSVLMADGSYTDFTLNNVYDCKTLSGGYILLDNHKHGVRYNKEDFERDFILQ